MSDFDWNIRVGEPVLSLPFDEGLPSPEKVKRVQSWFAAASDLYANNFVKMYHATDPSIDIEKEGLKPTTTNRRRSFQSESGYVYLANTPERAKAFGDLGNQGRSVVYEVIVRVRFLLPDKDQLHNLRSVGNKLGNSIGESIVYGGGARVKGAIANWAVRKLETPEPSPMAMDSTPS